MPKRSLLPCLTVACLITAAEPALARPDGGRGVQAYVARQASRARLAWARHVVLPVTSGLLARSVQNRPPDDPVRVIIERNLTAVRTCMQPLVDVAVPRPLGWREARRGRSLLGAAKAMVAHKVKRDIAVTRRNGWRLHRQLLQQERDNTTALLQSRGAEAIRQEIARSTPWVARQKNRVALFVLGQHVRAVNTLRQLDALPPR